MLDISTAHGGWV